MAMTTQSPRRLEGRVALVTGASRGIGAAVTEALAAEGARLVLVARTVGALEAMDDRIRALGSEAVLIPQDLTDPAKLDVLGPVLAERFGRLDILVSAAAHVGTHGPLAHAEPKQWSRTFATIVDANMRLIRTLDPLLRGSDAGRAVFITDRVARQPAAYWNGYAAAKAALEMMVRLYALETAKTPVRANLVDPGPVATALRAKIFPGENAAALRQPADVAPGIAALAMPDCTLHGELVKLFEE